MTQDNGHTAVDFESVSIGVLDAIRPVIEREMKEASNQLYGATMEAVQDYLSDNVNFNIRSRLDAAERGRRAEWERAEGLAKANAALLEALEAARQTILDLKNARWSECEGSDAEWVAEIDAALIQARGESVSPSPAGGRG